MHFCDQAPSPPPPHLNQITQQWCTSTELELRIPKMYLYLDESGPVKSWSPSQELPDSPPTSPPKPLRIVPSIYQLIALDVRVPSTTVQKVIILDASCCTPKINMFPLPAQPGRAFSPIKRRGGKRGAGDLLPLNLQRPKTYYLPTPHNPAGRIWKRI